MYVIKNMKINKKSGILPPNLIQKIPTNNHLYLFSSTLLFSLGLAGKTPAKNRQRFPRRNINVLIDIVTKRRERYVNRFFKNRPFPWEQMEGLRFPPLDGVPHRGHIGVE
jgi:hypothetical protein